MNGWILGVIVFFIILFLKKAAQDRKREQEKIRNKLENEWGKPTRTVYSDKIWENIKYHTKEHGIDAITWNDLNLPELYQQMNHTRTSAGEMILYEMLRTPLFQQEELLRRERLISALQKNETGRRKLEEVLFYIGKEDRFSVYGHLLKIKQLKPFSKLPHLFCAGMLLTGTVLLFFLPAWYLLLFLGILLFNTFFYFHEKGKHLHDISLFHFIFHMLRGCEELSGISFSELEDEINEIRSLTLKFQKYRRFHFLVAGGREMSGNVFDSLFDYLRILFHLDLMKYATMVEEIKKYEEELVLLFEKTGELDSLLSVASYRTFLKDYTIPDFTEQTECTYQAEELYHPLVKQPVKNSITMKEPVLLTGSNASGKSTFLKAVALSIIFAQTIHTVTSGKYQAPFYRVYSSMALRDNILAKESYFVVEIKSLKRLFDAGKVSEVPVFCFVDEILRGTNTVERVSASSVLLEFLAKKQIMCMAATHDIELSYLLEGIYENYHFEEQVTKEEVLFDYLIKKGAAKTRNAILLMENLGFEKILTNRAKERAEHFINTGTWHQ